MRFRLKIRPKEIGASLWAIMGAAFLFRLVLMRYHHAIFMDEAHYIRMGAAFSEGHWQDIFHAFWSPGYPFFIGLATSLFKHHEIVARLLNVLFGVLTVWPIYRLGTRLFNRSAGVLVAWFWALYPAVAYMDSSVLAEPSFIFWGVLGVWLGWQALERKKTVFFFLTGLCFGLSYLCKPEGFSFSVVYVGVLIVMGIVQFIRFHKIKIGARLSLFLAGFFLVSSPYLIFLRHEGGTWMLSGKGAAFQQWHSTFFTPEDDDVFHDLDKDCTTFKNDAILHFGTFLREMRGQGNYVPLDVKILLKKYFTYLFRVLKDGVPSMLTLVGCALFALGAFGGPVPRPSVYLFLFVFLFLGFYWFVVIPMFVVENRYLASMLPLAALFLGRGMMVFSDWVKGMLNHFSIPIRHQEGLSKGFTVFVVVATLFLPGLAQLAQHTPSATGEWEEAVEVKMAGEWIRENTKEKPPVIMTENKAVDFYAGNYRMRTGASFPQDNRDRILRYARNREVAYFVVVERYLHNHPVLQRWVKGDLPEELNLLKIIQGPSGQRVWIFGWKAKADSATDNEGQ